MNGISSAQQAADKRHPCELLLEEVLIHWNMISEQHAQYDNVRPTFVVADQQIPVFAIQPFQPFNIPTQLPVNAQ